LLEDTTDKPVFAIYRILEDKAGYLWWSSNINICRVKRKQLNDLIDSIRFHFTAPTFISQERVFFKIKLESYDKEWFLVYPHERRTIEYRNLSSGGYKFRVTACNNDGVWNKDGVDFLFVKIRQSPFFARFLPLSTCQP
jgi:hypothetical protein